MTNAVRGARYAARSGAPSRRVQRRASSAKQPPSQRNDSPVSRPLVAKSQNGGRAATTRPPSGSATSPCSRTRATSSEPQVASASPAADASSPAYTATSLISVNGATTCPTASTTSQRVLVPTSTRSPTLKTGP
ncbi:MAG: hypothetical protein JWN77_3238 [Frankiales bacterium]|nr:hypothetical protein [Frankiales bacterium]